MVNFLHLPIRRYPATLVLRVGKTEIDFLLFSKKNTKVEVLAYGNEPIQHYTILQVLERIFLRFPNKNRIEKLIATFDAASFRAQVITVPFPPKNPLKRITGTEARHLEKEVLARAQRIFQETLFSESGIHPKDFSLQKMSILERKIGGYQVPHLEGFFHREGICSVLGIFLLGNVLRPIQRFALQHGISQVEVIHVAEALELFSLADGHSGIYVCVEEEKTRVALRHNKTFLFLGAMDMGSEHFADFFGNKIGMQESTARFLEKRYFEGDLSTAVEEKIQAYLLPETRKFGEFLHDTLVTANAALPDSIWLFGRGSALRNLSDVLSESFLEDLPFSQTPKISFLLPKDVWSDVPFAGVNDPLYTELCLLGKFSIQEHEKKTH